MARDLGLELVEPLRSRLLLEVHDAALPVHLQDPEAGGLLAADRKHADGRVRDVPAVRLLHLPVVHLVELIAREHEHVTAAMAPEVPAALPHGVGGALEPVRALFRLLGREHRDERRAEDVELVGHRQVLVEALRVVLRQHEDPAQVGVQAVADRDVDQPVLARDRHGRLRALAREREETGPPATTEDDGQAVVHGHEDSATALRCQAGTTLVGCAPIMTDATPVLAVSRPGFVRRAGAGAWHVPAGFGFLLRRPAALAARRAADLLRGAADARRRDPRDLHGAEGRVAAVRPRRVGCPSGSSCR